MKRRAELIGLLLLCAINVICFVDTAPPGITTMLVFFWLSALVFRYMWENR